MSSSPRSSGGTGPGAALAEKLPASRKRRRFFDLRRLPLYRAAGNFGWPILQKEIRADFRKYGFFFSHLICLAALGGGILWRVTTGAQSETKPEDIGRDIFHTFFVIQYLVVVVVFPAFSATALSEERSARTLDLLLTSDLRPAEIVWGKFLASSIYCLIYIIATVPLLSLSLLFAGVSLPEIGVAYAVLIGLTMLISMAGVFVSSCFSSNVRATLILYTFACLLAALPWFQDLKFNDTWFLEIHVDALGLILPSAVLFAYLFLFTANRLRPRSEDRSSKVRILTFLAVLGFLGVGAIEVCRAPPVKVESGFESLLMEAAAILLAATLLFTSEAAAVPFGLRRRFSRWTGLQAPLRIFAPGSFWGLAYSVALSGAATLVLGLLWMAVSPLAAAAGRELEAALTLPLYVILFGSLGFFLSSLDFTPLYTALTVFFVFLISLLLPVIFEIGKHADGLLSLYYLSPITLWHSLHPEPQATEGPFYLVYGVPVIRVAQGLFICLAILFTALGAIRCARKGYPLFSFFPSPKKPPAERVPA
jgi:ABC-type transport system involved in multi-copper enzyme maturation permease subunit